jgi:hypothetical protein
MYLRKCLEIEISDKGISFSKGIHFRKNAFYLSWSQIAYINTEMKLRRKGLGGLIPAIIEYDEKLLTIGYSGDPLFCKINKSEKIAKIYTGVEIDQERSEVIICERLDIEYEYIREIASSAKNNQLSNGWDKISKSRWHSIFIDQILILCSVILLVSDLRSVI